MQNHEKLGYCGIYCGGCSNFKEKVNCQGCREEKSLLEDCPTRACAIQKGIMYCGECNDFPCEQLSGFYNDGVKHHQLAHQNSLMMKKAGVDNWLRMQEAKHICDCGNRLNWFKNQCPKCEAKN